VIGPVVPTLLGLIGWRLDKKKYATTWDSGEGARKEGGRWNSVGRRVVYCSLDPATTIVELAVHTGFTYLNANPHVLTKFSVVDPANIRIVLPVDVPNANWLRPGDLSAGQQFFGDGLLAAHHFVLFPSVVSTHSWNLAFDPGLAKGLYSSAEQEAFDLDTRLDPP
jgi:RES domain-containing protein